MPAITPDPAPRAGAPVITPVSVSNPAKPLITIGIAPVKRSVDTLLLGTSVSQWAGPALPLPAHEISHVVVEPSLHASVALPLQSHARSNGASSNIGASFATTPPSPS